MHYLVFKLNVMACCEIRNTRSNLYILQLVNVENRCDLVNGLDTIILHIKVN